MFNLSGTISNQFFQLFDFYAVETSVDLTHWAPLTLLLRTNNNSTSLLFQDREAVGSDQRFYRIFTNHLLTAFPQPSGPFAVGMVDRVMMDSGRTNLNRYSPPTNKFMVTFRYPADPPSAGILPAPMWEQRLAADTALYAFGGYDTRWAAIAPKLTGHRFVGIPLASKPNKFPIILFSHGLPAWRKLISQIAEELSSHGYVVVAMDHADCWATEFPDGRYLAGNRAGDVPGRLKDMQFLLDELGVLNSRDPLFAGRFDLDRLGVIGGSHGGMVIETCRTDNRVKCAAIYDAVNLRNRANGLQKPFLAALGEINSNYSEHQWLFSKAVTNAISLQIRGANHFTPCDIGWTAQIPWGRGPALAYNACLVWFFDTYLKGETRPFPTNSEIYNVQRK